MLIYLGCGRIVKFINNYWVSEAVQLDSVLLRLINLRSIIWSIDWIGLIVKVSAQKG